MYTRWLPSTTQSHLAPTPHTHSHFMCTFSFNLKVTSCPHVRWTLHYIRPKSRNFHHSQLGHHWSNIYTVQKSHLASMRGDFKGLCRVVPSTPQKSPRVGMRWLWAPCVELPPPPFKVTSRAYSHLTYTFSPRVHILTSRTYSHLMCSPPPKKISFTWHVHARWLLPQSGLVPSREVTLHYIRSNSRNFHHFQLGHHWSNIYTVQKSHLVSTRGDFKGLCRVVPSTPQSHLTCMFSPCIHILTSCTYSHLACPLHHSKSPHIHILTLHTYSHLTYTFSPRIHILTSCTPLHHSQSPRVHPAYTFSPRVHILTSHAPLHPK